MIKDLVFEQEKTFVEPDKLYDRSRYGHTVTDTNVTYTRLPSGLYIASYNGSNGYTTIAESDVLCPPEMSYFGWLQPNDFAQTYNSMYTYESIGKGNTLLVKSIAKLAIYLVCTSGSVNYDGSGIHTLTAGIWYHLGFTYDVTNGLVGYVNAVVDGTAAAGGVLVKPTGKDMGLGWSPQTASREFNCQMVLNKLYRRAFTASQVFALFQKERVYFGV